VQHEILDNNPTADLRVYTIWFNMYPGDARWRWDGAGLTDARVEHFWDEQKAVGSWFSATLTHRGNPTWDFYALYPRPGQQCTLAHYSTCRPEPTVATALFERIALPSVEEGQRTGAPASPSSRRSFTDAYSAPSSLRSEPNHRTSAKPFVSSNAINLPEPS